MTRSLRSAHRALWIALAVALALGIGVALVFRAPAHAGTELTRSEAR